MHFTTLVASAALAASSVSGLATTKQFNLVTSSAYDEFNGLYITGFHTASGEAVVIANNATIGGAMFSLTGGNITTPDGSPPVSDFLGFASITPANSTAPKNYKLVTLNTASGSQGFSISGAKHAVSYKGSVDFKTFAVCDVNSIFSDPEAGPQKQLLWTSSSKGAPEGCGLVKLHAKY